MAQQYSTGKDKGTFSGGYTYMLRALDGTDTSDVWTLRGMLWDLTETARDERSSFWNGQHSCLMDALATHPDAMEGVA